MISGLAVTLLVASLVWALWCAVSAVLGQAPTTPHRLGLVVLEVGALVQAVIAVVLLGVQGDRSGTAVAEIVGYLIATLVALPGGAWLAHTERSRYGSIVLAVAGLTLAVLVLRTLQVWDVTGA